MLRNGIVTENPVEARTRPMKRWRRRRSPSTRTFRGRRVSTKERMRGSVAAAPSLGALRFRMAEGYHIALGSRVVREGRAVLAPLTHGGTPVMMGEFKAFLMKHGVVGLAVAVVIGGAVGKLVTALVADFIMPVV